MQTIGNQILFKPLPSDEVTESGLFVPENARAISDKGIIVQVGNGSPKRPMRLKEGQTVYRVHQWGEAVFVNNELHFIMDEKAIIAVE